MTDSSRAGQVHLYVAGRLEGAALEEFEAALFSDERLLCAVEEEPALRRGLAGMAPPDAKPMPRQERFQPMRRWLPLAASFALGAIGSALFVHRISDGGAVQENIAVFQLESLRGTEPAMRRLRVPGAARSVVFQIPVSADSKTLFHLTICDKSGTAVVNAEALHRDSEGVLGLIVPAAALPPGEYRATLQR